MVEFGGEYRFVFGAGGTGGHLYPALAVAEKIRELKPQSEILFMGNKNKIEGKVVPKSGFDFKPIVVSGFHRGEILRNLLFPFKLLIGMAQSLKAAMKFKPQVAVGTGAYVSGPVMWAAGIMGAKIVLLEQNSYPGITNRLLDKKAVDIFTAFEETKKYFRFPEKVKTVGNPIRVNLNLIPAEEAKRKLNVNPDRKTLLILGGSLGARSVNEAVAENIEKFKRHGYSLLWQTGATYFEEYKKFADEDVKIIDFIEEVALYYSAADLIVARAGATTIAEISALGLAAVFVPSPNVAANHQFKNAEELAKNNAALIIEDGKLKTELFDTVNDLMNDSDKLNAMKENIKKFGNNNAAEIIAKRVIELAEKF